MGKNGAPSRIGKARTAVRLAVIVLFVVGLGVGSGWGTLCVAGVNSIAALCPLGALESLLAAKFAVPQVLLAVVCALVVIALLGRTFCAWICPVPPISSFFHPEKKGEVAHGEHGESCGSSEGHENGESASLVKADGEAHEANLVERRSFATAAGGNKATGNGKEEAARPSALAPLSESEKAVLASSCAHGGCGQPLSAVGGKRDGLHFDMRHVVLVGALASSAVFGFPVFCLVCPVGLTFATLVSLWGAIVGHEPTWSLLVFPAILFLELVVFRKWCHVLCPMGALMSLVGAKAPLAKPRVNAEACLRMQGIDCHVCVESCPEGLDPHSTTLAECTRCGLCAQHCPSGAVSMKLVSGKSACGNAACGTCGEVEREP